MPCHSPSLRGWHLNLFDFLLDYLRGRNFLEKVLVMQKKEGNRQFLRRMFSTLSVESNLLPYFANTVEPLSQNMVPISGVGSAYPLVKTSTLLSNLHGFMRWTQFVVFNQGKYAHLLPQALFLF